MILLADTICLLRQVIRTEDKLNDTQIELQACQKELDDPHRCVSICEEEFKKMGC